MARTSKLDYPKAFQSLIEQFGRLPGIGPRSAERIALWLLPRQREFTEQFAEVLATASKEVFFCPTCGFFKTVEEACSMCTAERENPKQLCVVEDVVDVLRIESSGAFHGSYHCLGGKLSPLNHVGPEDLRITGLKERVQSGIFEELILALSSNVEGDATAHYLAEMLESFPIQISRPAQGLPAGSGLEFADSLTLSRAMEGRRPVEQ